MLLFIVGVIGFQAHVSAEDIVLRNGKVLKDATIVGETDRALIIQYDDGVKSFPRSIVLERYHPKVDESSEDVVSAEPISANASSTAPELKMGTVSDKMPENTGKKSTIENPFSFDDPSPVNTSSNGFDGSSESFAESDYDFGSAPDSFLEYVLESNKASSQIIIAMFSDIPSKWLWIGSFVVIVVITLASLIIAIFFRIIAAITRLPLANYGDCYRLVWLASMLIFALTVASAIYAPKAILWPWSSLVIGLFVGGGTAMFVYGKSPMHGLLAYFVFWLLGTGLGLGNQYLNYSSGVPVAGIQQIDAFSNFLREYAGMNEVEPEIDYVAPERSSQYEFGQEGAPPKPRKKQENDDTDRDY